LSSADLGSSLVNAQLTELTTSQNHRMRSEIETKQRPQFVGHLEPERRLRPTNTPILGAQDGRERQKLWPRWAMFVRWLVVGALVSSASIWVIKASRPPPLPDAVATSEPAPGAVTRGQVESSRPPESDAIGAQCGSCRRASDAPTDGRLASEAELLSLRRGPRLEPKDTFKDCEKCPEMVVVPAGKFTMGSPDSEKGHNPDEGPQRVVTMRAPFAVGRFALTFDEWDACAADRGCSGYRPPDHNWGRGRQPVTNITWNDANAYVAWLSEKTGRRYRLLTEAEREYVTRAGSTSAFWWGFSISTNQANYDGGFAFGDSAPKEYRGKTQVVDSFPPNPWGLYQIHGNVYEWVEDCYHDSYRGAALDGTARISDDCESHVARGGSWLDDPRSLRSAHRLRLPATTRFRNLGFRVARSLTR
jgi:formylglycine-generating enzyme required for sulfatase activity